MPQSVNPDCHARDSINEFNRLLSVSGSEARQQLKTLPDVTDVSFVTSIPPDSQGEDGYVAINTTTGEFYSKSGGTWSAETNLATQAQLDSAVATLNTAINAIKETVDNLNDQFINNINRDKEGKP